MRKRRIVLLVMGAVALVVVVVCYVGKISGYAPMVAMPVKITRGGQAIAAEEVVSVQYAFSEKTTSDVQLTTPSPLKAAERISSEFYLVTAPFSVMKKGPFSGIDISPLYRSLLLRVTLKQGSTTTLIYPVLSDTKLNQAIYVDLPGVP